MLDNLYEDVQQSSESDLAELSKLAEQQVDAEQKVKALESALADAKEELKKLQEQLIPDMMLECGVSEFKLTSGLKVTVKPYYSASIKDEKAGACFRWLEETGNDSIIKNEVTVTFGRGEDSRAKELTVTLAESGYLPVNKKAVHPQTLKAFVKEQVESGADFPLELFNVYIGKKSTIK